MRLKLPTLSLLLSGAAIIASMALTSCTTEEQTIPQEELYTREFIKTFGIIDSKQDWNLVAQRARLAGASSARPKTTYPTYEKLNVSIAAITDGNGHPAYLTLDTESKQNALNTLPERADFGTDRSQTNYEKVTQNFFVKASEFYIFPEYWNTSGYLNNEIGIYYFVNSDVEGAVKVTTNDGDERYVIHVPIFQGGIEQLKYCTHTLTYFNSLTEDDLNSLIPKWFEKLSKAYPDLYKIADGTEEQEYYGFCTSGDMIVRCSNDENDTNYNKWCTLKSKASNMPEWITKQIHEFFPEVLWNYGASIIEVTGEENLNSASSTYGDAKLYRSYGTRISFGEEVSFGFYIAAHKYSSEASSELKYLYSQGELNGTAKFDGFEPENACYVATFVDETDTEGNDRRYICFEDWWLGVDEHQGGNFDLNDMVFRVYGFDNYREGIDEPTGDVIDEDDPEPDPEPTPEEKEWTVEEGLLVCEDLGNTDDIDFNDIVLKLQHKHKTITEENKSPIHKDWLVITPMAAGGTLVSNIAYNDGTTNRQLGEIHNLLGGASPNIINAHSFDGAGDEIVIDNIPWDNNNYSSEDGKGFVSQLFDEGYIKITVQRTNSDAVVIERPNIGEAPQMMLLPVNWWWPTERTNIETVYPEFSSWVKNVENTLWHKNHTNVNVVKHCTHTSDDCTSCSH